MNEQLLRRAIELAVEARASGNPPFGSLLAGPDGTVLLEERKSTMYTSCEPCGMCAGALARSGIGQVVFALSAEQLDGLRTGGGFPRVPTDGPHLYDEAKAAVEGYYP